MTTRLTVAVTVTLIVILGGCAMSAPASVAPAPFRIGTLQALTGENESLGRALVQSIQLATDEINAAGGVAGRRLELVVEDSKCEGTSAVTAYTKLVTVDRIQALIGSTCSGEMLAVADRIDRDRVPSIVNVSHPDATRDHPFIFRNVPTSASDAEVTARALHEAGIATVAVVTQQTDFASAFSEHVQSDFARLGGTFSTHEKLDPATADFRTVATKILSTNPQTVVASFQTEVGCANFVRQLRGLGYKDRIIGTSPCTSGTALEIGGEAMTGLQCAIPPLLTDDNVRGQAFLSRYAARFGSPANEFFQAAAYDAPYLLKAAIAQVGSLDDPDAIRTYLSTMSEYAGSIGTYHFDADREIAGITDVMVEVLPVSQRGGVGPGYKLLPLP